MTADGQAHLGGLFLGASDEPTTARGHHRRGNFGGLTAALAMHRRGIDVTVHERASAIGEIGAGMTLSPDAIKAVAGVGPSRTRSPPSGSNSTFRP